MPIEFVLSGSKIAESPSSCVPSIGDEVTIRTSSYKKGIDPGTMLTFTVSEEFPPHYDYSRGDDPVIYIDVDGYTIHDRDNA